LSFWNFFKITNMKTDDIFFFVCVFFFPFPAI